MKDQTMCGVEKQKVVPASSSDAHSAGDIPSSGGNSHPEDNDKQPKAVRDETELHQSIHQQLSDYVLGTISVNLVLLHSKYSILPVCIFDVCVLGVTAGL